MARTRRTLLGAVAGTLAIAGCLGDDGGSGAGGDATTAPPSTEPAATEPTATETTAAETTAMDGGSATVQIRSHPDHGDILAGPEGLTLYMFDADEQGAAASSCSGGCADAWPPLTADAEPTAGDGVDATLSTFDRDGGTTQVAANGWPLYYYASDTEPGDATGQGVNDVWWVLASDGTPVRAAGTTTGTTSGGGGGGGGGSPY